ncbi:thiamine phosphate synthase [Aceticella autotrophica]|uniref:thiamine phosphate synthase n=1 Tax=Aceticella autotrophica TaxID=2755338 RepID=UPI00254270DF|nr:thiamine phosphate synthase [Aceticella autotrophica]
MGDDKIIGISAGNVDEVVKAEKNGADYIMEEQYSIQAHRRSNSAFKFKANKKGNKAS